MITELLGRMPMVEILAGMAAMSGLFVLFGLRGGTDEGGGGCGACSGQCDSCGLETGEDS